jgi:glycine cleavage system protein P-like pyridoxal-binding family
MELIKQEFDRIKHTIVIEDYTDEEKKPETDVFIEKLTEVNRDGDSALKNKEFEAEQKERADELERIENDKKEGENFDIEKRKLKVQRKLISLMRLL